MFLDHPSNTVTNSALEPDRIERLNHAYGDAKARADSAGNARFVGKLTRPRDGKGTLIVFRNEAPGGLERACFARAWVSKAGDGTGNVEHEC